jgi:plasmid stability protein
MQDKQKVTLYLPPGLHRQLKIRAAVDSDSMSAMVERAIVFYLHHSEVVEEVEASDYGRTHRVYACPECSSSVVLKEGEMVSLENQPTTLAEDLPVEKVREREEVNSSTDSQGEEELVPC